MPALPRPAAPCRALPRSAAPPALFRLRIRLVRRSTPPVCSVGRPQTGELTPQQKWQRATRRGEQLSAVACVTSVGSAAPSVCLEYGELLATLMCRKLDLGLRDRGFSIRELLRFHLYPDRICSYGSQSEQIRQAGLRTLPGGRCRAAGCGAAQRDPPFGLQVGNSIPFPICDAVAKSFAAAERAGLGVAGEAMPPVAFRFQPLFAASAPVAPATPGSAASASTVPCGGSETPEKAEIEKQRDARIKELKAQSIFKALSEASARVGGPLS